MVDNVITALNSNLMIAPNYWVDRKTGNDYFLTVQYFEKGSPAIHDLTDLRKIPLRRESQEKKSRACGPVLPYQKMPISTSRVDPPQPALNCNRKLSGAKVHIAAIARPPRPTTVLDNVVKVGFVQTPTEIDHYQIQRITDVYVTPAGEDLGKVTEPSEASWIKPVGLPMCGSICAGWCKA